MTPRPCEQEALCTALRSREFQQIVLPFRQEALHVGEEARPYRRTRGRSCPDTR